MDVGEVTKAPDSPAETTTRHHTETYTSDALKKARGCRSRDPKLSPPDELLKGLLGERATGCWELALNGLGKSETHTQGGGRREGDHSVLMAHSCPLTCIFSPTDGTMLSYRRNIFTKNQIKLGI